MTAWLGFLKKEWTESVKTYKLVLIVTIFSILGILNPFIAKITPVIMENVLPEGTVVNIPDPIALDSWLQFYKNVPQIGILFFLLLFSSMMSKELERGTLIILLTKGLRRSTVITTKWLTGVAYWTLAILLTTSITYIYTTFYWNQSSIQNLLFAIGCLYLFGILLFTVTFWANTVFASSFSALLITALLVIGLFTVSIIPSSAAWNPVELMSSSKMILTGDKPLSDFTGPILVTLGATVLILWSTVLHFNRKVI